MRIRGDGNQTEFLNLIIDHLTESDIIEPTRFSESPFTDFDDKGFAGVFPVEQAKRIIQIVRDINDAVTA